MKFILALLALFFAPLSAMANPLTVAADQSTITFAGKHAGNDFTGTFEKWTADIDFNANDLPDACIMSVAYNTMDCRLDPYAALQ